jgi:hypothetical protein
MKTPVFVDGGIADMQSAFPGRVEKHKEHSTDGCHKNGDFFIDKFHVSPLLVTG